MVQECQYEKERIAKIKKTRLAKFKPFIEKAGRGIFTTKTRRRLFGDSGLSGRDRTISDFWHDVKENVKNALVDLELFIEVDSRGKVNEVMTRETLAPIVNGLFQSPFPAEERPELKRAEIAQLFIEMGFSYLSKNGDHVTLSHRRTIDEAIDLSHYLMESFKPEGERRYYLPKTVW